MTTKPDSTRYCCGQIYASMCEDCPQLTDALPMPDMEWGDGAWIRDGVRYATWEQAFLGTPDAQPGDLWRSLKRRTM